MKNWIAASLSVLLSTLVYAETAPPPDPKPALTEEETERLLKALTSEDYQEREGSTRKLYQAASYTLLCRLYGALEKNADPEARGRMEELVPAILKEMGDAIYINDFQFLGPIPFPNDPTKVNQQHTLEWIRQPSPIDEVATLDLKAEYKLKPYLEGQQQEGAKETEIKASWKRPLEGQRGVCDFCKMYPEQAYWASVYALTFVKAEKPMKAKLFMGSDDGMAVWVNGTCIAFQDFRRAVVKDQDKMVVELKAGWNPVLIRVTNGWGMWGLSLRITEMNGMAWDDKKISPVCNGEPLPPVPGPKMPKDAIKPGEMDPGAGTTTAPAAQDPAATAK